MSKPTEIECPACKKTGDWFTGKYGPFCSHRCKLVDLGKWLNQEHAICGPLRPAALEPYAGVPPGEHLDKPEADEQG